MKSSYTFLHMPYPMYLTVPQSDYVGDSYFVHRRMASTYKYAVISALSILKTVFRREVDGYAIELAPARKNSIYKWAGLYK